MLELLNVLRLVCIFKLCHGRSYVGSPGFAPILISVGRFLDVVWYDLNAVCHIAIWSGLCVDGPYPSYVPNPTARRYARWVVFFDVWGR